MIAALSAELSWRGTGGTLLLTALTYYVIRLRRVAWSRRCCGDNALQLHANGSSFIAALFDSRGSRLSVVITPYHDYFVYIFGLRAFDGHRYYFTTLNDLVCLKQYV